jgi:hypothetical protein
LSKLRRSVTLIAAAAFFCACSTNPNRAPTGDRQDQTRITSAQIRSADPNLTLFDLISRERPQWLTKHGGTPLQDQSDVVVYRDDIRVGGPTTLGDIRLDIVSSVRYLTASEATGRFGLNHQHGAILVSTRR